MRKSIKRFTSVLLSAAMVSSFAFGITGCNKSTDSSSASSAVSTDSNIEDNGTEAQADAVEYSSKGVYTTTLKLENGGFDGITADDVQIAYVSEQPEKSDETEGGTDGENGAKYAEVLETTVNSDGSLSVTFEDKDAAAQKTQYYVVLIEKISVGAAVNVNFKEHNLTCDKDYVLSTDNAVKLTFTLDEGEYAQDVTKDDISLAGSFENMSVDSVSAAGKNLTMQLSGDIAFLESSNAYLDGVVTVSSDAVQDSILPLEAHVPVNTQGVYFDVEKLGAADNKITVPLVLVGTADITAFTPDDISFDGADITVESVSIIGDDEVSVVLNADGAVDKNSAAAILENSAVKVLDSDLVTGFTSASFYPVFDYIDEKDGNFEITVEIYANNGEFADGLSASSVSFGGDFDGAAATSLTRTSDTTAELIFTIPTNGQNTETIDLDGEIILSGGALINRWGDAKTEETSYTRNYSAENYGRGIDYDTDFLSVFEDLAGLGDNISSVVGGVESACEAITWALNLAGISTGNDKDDQIIAEINRANQRIDKIEQDLAEQNALLRQIIERDYQKTLGDFDGILMKMEQACHRADTYLQETAAVVQQPTSDDEQEWIDYSQAIVGEMSKFGEYNETMKEIRDGFNKALTALKADSSINPITSFDKLCTYRFNFETQSIETRLGYRHYIENAMDKALFHILVYYGYGNPVGVDNAAIKNYKSEFLDVIKSLNKYPVSLSTSYYIFENVLPFYDDVKYLNVEKPELERYTYCYVLNKSVNLDRFRVYTEDEFKKSKSQSSIMKAEFNESQLNEFVSRMAGRTLQQEFELALFGDNAYEKYNNAAKDADYNGDYDRVITEKSGVVFIMKPTKAILKHNFWAGLKDLFGAAGDDDYRWETGFVYISWGSGSTAQTGLVVDGDPFYFDWGNGLSFVEFVIK